ncbi:MAG: twin-arginine translocation signal domain-containing protein, partial [Alphaproteobacteria bacterium]
KSTARRDFIKKAGLGVGAAGVAAASLSSADARAETGMAKPASKAYRETDHVKQFYGTARF